MATLPFMAAKVAKEQGMMWCWALDEAVTRGRKSTAKHVTAVDVRP
jgi:hypothetical protein